VLCKRLATKHRLILPRHPQTNGMVERLNGRISEIVNQTRFASSSELESTLCNYLKIYNHNISHRALSNETPVPAIKKWQAEKPELFVKRVYNQTGLDRWRVLFRRRPKLRSVIQSPDKQPCDSHEKNTATSC